MGKDSAKHNDNSVPMKRVTWVRIGSANIKTGPAKVDSYVNLLRLLSEQVNARFSPAAANEPIWVQVKGSERATEGAPVVWDWYDSLAGVLRVEDGLNAQLPPIVPPADTRLWKPTTAQRVIGEDLFLCVLVRGYDFAEEPYYCYFGTHFDQIPAVLRCALEARPFNPADLKGAAVLARHHGDPHSEVRRFLRDRFSFEEDGIRLEVEPK